MWHEKQIRSIYRANARTNNHHSLTLTMVSRSWYAGLSAICVSRFSRSDIACLCPVERDSATKGRRAWRGPVSGVNARPRDNSYFPGEAFSPTSSSFLSTHFDRFFSLPSECIANQPSPFLLHCSQLALALYITLGRFKAILLQHRLIPAFNRLLK